MPFSFTGRSSKTNLEIRAKSGLLQTGPHKHIGTRTIIHAISFHAMTLPSQRADWKTELRFSITEWDAVVAGNGILSLLIYVDAPRASERHRISKQKQVLRWYRAGPVWRLCVSKYYLEKCREKWGRNVLLTLRGRLCLSHCHFLARSVALGLKGEGAGAVCYCREFFGGLLLIPFGPPMGISLAALGCLPGFGFGRIVLEWSLNVNWNLCLKGKGFGVLKP